MNDQQAKLSYRRIAIRMPYQFCRWSGLESNTYENFQFASAHQ